MKKGPQDKRRGNLRALSTAQEGKSCAVKLLMGVRYQRVAPEST